MNDSYIQAGGIFFVQTAEILLTREYVCVSMGRSDY